MYSLLIPELSLATSLRVMSYPAGIESENVMAKKPEKTFPGKLRLNAALDIHLSLEVFCTTQGEHQMKHRGLPFSEHQRVCV